MNLFGHDEYEKLYELDEEDSRNYEDLSEMDDDILIEKLRGTIGRGDCLYCGTKNGMEYEGNICFICKVCGRSVHEDIYYMWASGKEIEFDED